MKVSHALGSVSPIALSIASARLLAGATLAAAMVAGAAPTLAAEAADSEAGAAKDEVVVRGTRQTERSVADVVVETVPGSRATLSKPQLEKLAGIGSVYDSLKYLPAVNSVGGNSYGSGGAAFTIRGFTGNQIGIVRNGLPLNDPLFQSAVGSVIGDPEDYASIQVVYGSSAVSLPALTASGGSIILDTVKPTDDAGVFIKQSLGNYGVTKTYGRVNLGEHDGFSGWISASDSHYDFWRQSGDVPRGRTWRIGANLQYAWDEGGSINFIVSQQKMNNYGAPARSLAQYRTLPYTSSYPLTAYPTAGGTNGVVDTFTVPSAANSSQYTSLTTFNIQGYMVNAVLPLTDNVVVRIDPYFQRIDDGAAISGPVALREAALDTDLNGDGDRLDTVPFSRQMLPDQRRLGVTAKVDWQVAANDRFQFGAWVDWIKSRRTFSHIPIGADGRPTATDGHTGAVADSLGRTIYTENSLYKLPTLKIWAENELRLTPELKLTTSLGYQWSTIKGIFGDNLLVSSGANAGTLNSAPGFIRSQTYERAIPALALEFNRGNHQFYYNVTSNFHVPAAASLYTTTYEKQAAETTLNQEIGWRFSSNAVTANLALFHDRFKNRQISYADEFNITRYFNAGTVVTKGVEFAVNGFLPNFAGGFSRHLTYSLAYAYTLAEQQDNYVVVGGNGTGPAALPTKGKQLFNTPKSLATIGLGYDDGGLYGDVRALYKGSIYGDLTNKEKVPAVTIVNLSAGYRFRDASFIPGGLLKDVTLSVNVNNLFDKQYLQGVSTGQWSSAAADGRLAGTPTYTLGEPRTVLASLGVNF